MVSGNDITGAVLIPLHQIHRVHFLEGTLADIVGVSHAVEDFLSLLGSHGIHHPGVN